MYLFSIYCVNIGTFSNSKWTLPSALNHLNTKPFKIWTSKSSVFKCFRYSNGRYSDPHCIWTPSKTDPFNNWTHIHHPNGLAFRSLYIEALYIEGWEYILYWALSKFYHAKFYLWSKWQPFWLLPEHWEDHWDASCRSGLNRLRPLFESWTFCRVFVLWRCSRGSRSWPPGRSPYEPWTRLQLQLQIWNKTRRSSFKQAAS